METFKQLGIVLLVLSLGQILKSIFNIPIPRTILGMLILLLLLSLKIIKVERVEKVADTLLKHLSIFFVPANVGIITLFARIEDSWVRILLVLIISTVVVMAVTGLTVQFLQRVLNKEEKGDII